MSSYLWELLFAHFESECDGKSVAYSFQGKAEKLKQNNSSTYKNMSFKWIHGTWLPESWVTLGVLGLSWGDCGNITCWLMDIPVFIFGHRVLFQDALWLFSSETNQYSQNNSSTTWLRIVFTHRRSSDPRRTFRSEQTTRSLEMHTHMQAKFSQ